MVGPECWHGCENQVGKPGTEDVSPKGLSTGVESKQKLSWNCSKGGLSMDERIMWLCRVAWCGGAAHCLRTWREWN